MKDLQALVFHFSHSFLLVFVVDVPSNGFDLDRERVGIPHVRVGGAVDDERFQGHHRRMLHAKGDDVRRFDEQHAEQHRGHDAEEDGDEERAHRIARSVLPSSRGVVVLQQRMVCIRFLLHLVVRSSFLQPRVCNEVGATRPRPRDPIEL